MEKKGPALRCEGWWVCVLKIFSWQQAFPKINSANVAICSQSQEYYPRGHGYIFSFDPSIVQVSSSGLYLYKRFFLQTKLL